VTFVFFSNITKLILFFDFEGFWFFCFFSKVLKIWDASPELIQNYKYLHNLDKILNYIRVYLNKIIWNWIYDSKSRPASSNENKMKLCSLFEVNLYASLYT